jgi:hypothetical protein|tara:strand:+ start:250 stop:606 length:357 start_codon:yes stop_codon:yes gene_type:complete
MRIPKPMKYLLIFISGMFAGAFLLILFLFTYNATNPNYHECMNDWGSLPDHGCEDRWDAPKQVPEVEYYENGRLKQRIYYKKDGKRDGLFETYSMNGQLKSRDCFKNDEKVDMSYCEE